MLCHSRSDNFSIKKSTKSNEFCDANEINKKKGRFLESSFEKANLATLHGTHGRKRQSLPCNAATKNNRKVHHVKCAATYNIRKTKAAVHSMCVVSRTRVM